MKLIHPSDLDRSVKGAIERRVAASADTTGAGRLWVAYAEMGPGAASSVHHHGIAETVVFVLQGNARFYYGDGLTSLLDATGGDFVWMPPNEIHAEVNPNADEPLRMIVVRSPYDITIDVEPPAGWLLIH